MKILAPFIEDSLSLMRRVYAPFSVLSARGHAFSFMQVADFNAGLSFGADVTVLHNWQLKAQEVAEMKNVSPHCLFVADCSDPLLLDDDAYRAQLASVSLVTVPNEWLRSEIKTINSNVVVTPSCLIPEYFAQANKVARSSEVVIGCLGPYDWHLVKDALISIKQQFPKVIVCGGKDAVRVLGDIVTHVEPSTKNLPLLMHTCSFGLCPRDGEHGWDAIWEQEYGILCKPTISLAPPNSLRTQVWESHIEQMMSSHYRSEQGNIAYQIANEHRASKCAGNYLHAYRKRLPHLVRS